MEARLRSKKIEQLLTKVKKATATEPPLALPAPVVDKPISKSKETFMTAAVVPPTDQDLTDDALMRQYEELAARGEVKPAKGKPLYDNMADELLDDLDQQEKEMNDMMKYLTEVEELIKGQDLQSIQSMMDVTKDVMSQHMVAYDKFKEQIDQINSQADAAISSLTFYDPEPRKPSDSRALAQVKEEEPASDTSSEPDGLESSDSDEDRVARPLPNRRKGGSQEEKKSDIVKTLMGMST